MGGSARLVVWVSGDGLLNAGIRKMAIGEPQGGATSRQGLKTLSSKVLCAQHLWLSLEVRSSTRTCPSCNLWVGPGWSKSSAAAGLWDSPEQSPDQLV